MNTKEEMKLNLQILAAYSLVIPLLVGIVASDGDSVLFGLPLLVPFTCYWIIAREFLLSGWQPWLIHVVFIFIVLPLSLVAHFFFIIILVYESPKGL